jgi:hypothetical protein
MLGNERSANQYPTTKASRGRRRASHFLGRASHFCLLFVVYFSSSSLFSHSGLLYTRILSALGCTLIGITYGWRSPAHYRALYSLRANDGATPIILTKKVAIA